MKIGDGGYVNASCKGYDYLKIDGKPVQFRVTALGKRRFRISTESTGYVKVLANSKGGKLSFADLEPETQLRSGYLTKDHNTKKADSSSAFFTANYVCVLL